MTSVDSRVRKMTWALLGVAVGGLVGSLLLGVVVVAQIRSAQVDRLPKSEQNDETLAVIKDCTEPGGECYQRNQRRTAEAVGDIGAANILAVVCALAVPDGTPTRDALEQVTECVSKRLSRD